MTAATAPAVAKTSALVERRRRTATKIHNAKRGRRARVLCAFAFAFIGLVAHARRSEDVKTGKTRTRRASSPLTLARVLPSTVRLESSNLRAVDR